MKAKYDEDRLATAQWAFFDEIKQWRVIEFDLMATARFRAIREDGRIESFTSKDDANDFIKRRAAEAMLNYWISPND